MRIREPITDPVEKVCDEADTAFAVLFIGRDHGVTPQAMGCIEKTLDLTKDLDDPVVKQVRETFSLVKLHGDKVWDNEEHVRQICLCCVAVRDIYYKEWKNDEWMEARPSWLEGL